MFNFFRALQLKRLYMGRGGASAPGRESLFKGLKPILYGGREVWPLIEGGKGVSATNHASSGAWAAAGGIGTVSARSTPTATIPKAGSSRRSMRR